MHVILSRKWRPQTFGDVVGQDHVITTLQNSIAADRIAHAYLFSGPRGTGKTTVARIFAKAVNCLNLQSPDTKPEPCNECINCRSITAGRTFDVIEMDAASSRGIDQIRDLRDNVKLAASSCRYKVYIIDEVHMLTPEAFNALLKTLEEPPEHVIFILATTERHKVLETITSRCLQFAFRRLSYDEIANRLHFLARTEGFDVEEEAISLVARNCDGCLRDAENMIEQMIASGDGRITADYASSMLGIGSTQLINSLMKAILDQELPESIRLIDRLMKTGADLTQCLKNLTGSFHDLMLLKISPELAEQIDAPRNQIAEMMKMVSDVSLDRLRRIVKILMRTEQDIKKLGYEQFNLDASLVELCHLRDGVPIDQAIQKLEELESKIESMPTAVSQPIPIKDDKPTTHGVSDIREDEHPKSSVQTGTFERLDETWNELLSRVKENSVMLSSFLGKGRLVSIDQAKVSVAVPSPMIKEIIEREDNREILSKILRSLLRRDVALEIEVNEEASQEEENAENAGRPTQLVLYQRAMRDDGVRMVLNSFSGEIVEVND